MKVSLRPVEAFELIDDAGKTVAHLRVTSRWEGLMRLATDDGQALIAEEPSGFAAAFGGIFTRVFGDGSTSNPTLTVIKISPELLAKLTAAAAPAAACSTCGKPLTVNEKHYCGDHCESCHAGG